MLAQLTAIDKVSIVALAKDIQAESKCSTIAALAGKLGIPLMNEWRNRKRIVERLATPRAGASFEGPPRTPAASLAAFLIAFLLERSEAFRKNHDRRSYAGWFKRLCVDARQRGYSYAEIAELTGIDSETLGGFKDTAPMTLQKSAMDDKTKQILEVWNAARPWNKNTLDRFLGYFSKQAPGVAVGRDELRQTLINLGQHTPRGPKIKNEGAQVKRPFAPHALWEGDGKLVKVRVNGVDTRWR